MNKLEDLIKEITPLPWDCVQNTIEDRSGLVCIASVYTDGDNMPDGIYICHAVNMFPRLVQALRDYVVCDSYIHDPRHRLREEVLMEAENPPFFKKSI